METKGLGLIALTLALVAVSGVAFNFQQQNVSLTQEKYELESDLQEANSSISNLKTDKSNLESDISDLENETSALNENIEALESTKEDLNSELNDIENRAMASSGSEWVLEDEIITVEFTVNNYGLSEVSNAVATCGLAEEGSNEYYEKFNLEGIDVASESQDVETYDYDVSGIERSVSDDVMACVLTEVEGLNLDRRIYGDTSSTESLFEDSGDDIRI